MRLVGEACYDPLRPAATRYDPLRFGSHGSLLTVRFPRFGFYGSVLTVRTRFATVLCSRFGSHGSIPTVGFAWFGSQVRFTRLGSHGSVRTVGFRTPWPGSVPCTISNGSVRTVWFTRFGVKSKIANRKSVECESESYCFRMLSLQDGTRE